MRRTRPATLAATLSLAAIVAAGCRADRGPDSAGRRARLFYEALNAGAFADARAMTLDDAAVDRLERRFGSIEAWGNRLTKNGIVSHVEAIAESAEGHRSRVELMVMFNDGTRRNDVVSLVKVAEAWRVDAAGVEGAWMATDRDEAGRAAR